VESKKTKSKKGTNKSMIKCFSCGEMGHYKSKCPKNKSKNATSKQLEKEDTVLMMVEAEFKAPQQHMDCRLGHLNSHC